MDADRFEAVERFDQLGQTPMEDAAENTDVPGGEQGESQAGYAVMKEQWLEHVEGNPGLLLQKRFMLEEHRRMQPDRVTGAPYEPRPW
jgi:hypothetical protein